MTAHNPQPKPNCPQCGKAPLVTRSLDGTHHRAACPKGHLSTIAYASNFSAWRAWGAVVEAELRRKRRLAK